MVATATRTAWRGGVGRLVLPLGCLCLAALFVFCHPYIGIHGDASIYVMHALADLDPAGLGRDFMVVDDGQMRLSLFPSLLRPLVAALGAANAAMLVAAVGSAAWLAALSLLARRLAPGRIAFAMVAMVAVLPLGYGEVGGLFSFAETSATPRPLAEALVMAGLAALLAGRPTAMVLALAFAALIHPIMASAGIGLAALVLLWRLPRSGQVAVVAIAASAALAALGLGLAGRSPFDRLLVRPDAAWLGLLRQHGPYLFPTLWTGGSYSPLLAQAATMIVAAHRAAPLQRRLYTAALVVCAVGLVTSVVGADALHLLVAIQAQAWRATWLVGVLGGCALTFCTAVLWQDGPRSRIVLALLALAWFFQPAPVLTLAVAGLAIVLEFGSLGARMTHRHVVLVYAVVAILSLYWASGAVLGYIAYLRGLPPGEMPSLTDPLRNHLQSLPLAVAIAAWLVAPARFAERPFDLAALAIGCLGLVTADVLVWDQRGAAEAYLESPHALDGLAAMAAGRNPEVLWLEDESHAWLALGRRQYFSRQQAVSMVFSRTLALEWAHRADGLIKLGLVPKNVFTPGTPAADDDRALVTQAAVDAFCARPDAPGLLVVPRDSGKPTLRDMVAWPLPTPLFRPERFVSSDEQRRIEGFGIVPCAPRIGTLPR